MKCLIKRYSMYIASRSPAYYLWLMIAAQIILHAPMLNLPPLGQHTWRQVVGHAAARNYFEEDDRFLYPRSDIRLSRSDTGAIYHEFPLTYWLVGASYRLTGFQHLNARIIPFLLNLLAIFGAFHLGKALGYTEKRSLWYAFFLSFSPLFMYYAPTLVPNQLGLTFFLCGSALIASGLNRDRVNKQFIVGGLVIALATTVKPTYLFFGLPIAILFFQRWAVKRNWRLFGWALAVGLFVLATNIFVIKHAKSLYDASPPDRQVHTPIGPAESPENWQHIWSNIEPAMTKWFFEMLVNLAALPFFIIGLYLLVRSSAWRTRTGRFWLAWTTSFIIFAALFVVRLRDHDYYITSLLPIAALVSSRGAEFLSSMPRYRKAVIPLVLLVVFMGFKRVSGRWWGYVQVPEQLLEQPEQISQYIPKDDLVLIVGDSTPVTYLYFLNRKGLSLDTSVTPLDQLDLTEFDWVVHYLPRRTLGSAVQELDLQKIKKIGDFEIYRILH